MALESSQSLLLWQGSKRMEKVAAAENDTKMEILVERSVQERFRLTFHNYEWIGGGVRRAVTDSQRGAGGDKQEVTRCDFLLA